MVLLRNKKGRPKGYLLDTISLGLAKQPSTIFGDETRARFSIIGKPNTPIYVCRYIYLYIYSEEEEEEEDGDGGRMGN